LENRNAARIAVAVERFRRKHGGLPETLDALVPEFLENVPDSIFNEGPFAYARGEVCVSLERFSDHPKFVHGYQISSVYKESENSRERWGACFTVPLKP